jgi:hypothetical protein
MGYETYRPDWDPFFSDPYVPPEKASKPIFDRASDPTASRSFILDAPRPSASMHAKPERQIVVVKVP